MDEVMTVDERNGKLVELFPWIVKEPVVNVNDVVVLSPLGISAGLGEAGERFVVVRIDERWGKVLGDVGRVVEMWCFDENGELRKLVSDPKFLTVIEPFVKSDEPKKVVRKGK